MAEAAVNSPVAMAAVMDAMNGCMRPANAAAESLTTGFASASEYFFSLSLWRSRAMVGLINCSYTLNVDVVWLRGKSMIG